jgi:hypothetical protein
VSTGLAAHGAGPYATPRVAQAVAVRVLTERGWTVEGWTPEADPDQRPAGEPTEPAEQVAPAVVFRARVRLPAAVAATPEPRTASRRLGLRSPRR